MSGSIRKQIWPVGDIHGAWVENRALANYVAYEFQVRHRPQALRSTSLRTVCPFIGLRLDKQDLIEAALVRKPGVDLGLFDELSFWADADATQAQSQASTFVLTKIDEILAWERQKEAERDTRFVELGRYLCDVRARQYWRLEKLKSFDEFLAGGQAVSGIEKEGVLPHIDPRIHEHLPPQARKDVGMWDGRRTKGLELAKVARRDGQHFDCATWLHKSRELPKEDFRREVEKGRRS